MANNIDKNVEQIIERLQESRNIVEYFQQIAKLTGIGAEDAKALEQALKGVSKDTKDILNNFEGVRKGTRKTADIQKDLARSLKTERNSRTEINNLLNKAGLSQSKARRFLEDTVKNSGYLLEAKKKLSAADYKILEASVAQYSISKENIETNTENLEIAKNYNKALGLSGGLVGGVADGLKKVGFESSIVNDALEEARDNMLSVAEEITEGGTKAATLGQKFKVLGAGASSLGINLAKGLLDPLVITQQIVAGIFEVDNQAGNLAKNFGISYRQALGISDSLNDAANASYLLNVTTAGVSEAFIEINNRYGTFAKLNTGNLETFQQLKEVVGLSAESIGKISDITLLTGKAAEDVSKEFLGQAKALALQNNLALNEKEIFDSIKDVSAATLLSLKGQPEVLATTVVKAKALGVSLGEVEKIAESLLDFESSITSELEAELLTGKNLNLERARFFALSNNIAGVAEEITKQIGNAENFSKMNVIQQEALAKSVGMQREELAKALMERKAMAALEGTEGATAKERFDNLVKEVGMEEAKRRLGDESLSNMYANQNLQERMAAAMSKVQEIFVSLAEPLMPVLDALAGILNFIGPVVGFLGKAIKFTVEWGKYLIPVYGAYKLIALYQKRGALQAIAANALNKVGLITDRQKAFWKGREVYFENVKAGLTKQHLLFDKASIVNSVRKTLLGKIEIFQEGVKNRLKQIGVFLENSTFLVKLKNLAALGREIFMTNLLRLKKAATMALDVGKLALQSAIAVAQTPVVGPLLIGAAVAAAIALGSSLISRFKGDDVVSPGYGKRTLLAPEGAIELNNKDTVIAGTNLGGGGGGMSLDISPLVAELQAIKAVLSQILNKEGTVIIDTTRAGTAFAMGTSKLQ